jgi:hypothetical protein
VTQTAKKKKKNLTKILELKNKNKPGTLWFKPVNPSYSQEAEIRRTMVQRNSLQDPKSSENSNTLFTM